MHPSARSCCYDLPVLLTANAKIHAHRFGIGSCSSATGVEAAVVVGQAGSDGVSSNPLPRLADQIAERRQRHQLSRGEEVAPRRSFRKLPYAESERLSGITRHPASTSGLALTRNCFMLGGRREVDPASRSLSDNRHQLLRPSARPLPSSRM